MHVSCILYIFSGRYEYPPSAYKHMYFNATSNTLKMWLVVVLGLLAFYECLRYLLSTILKRALRTQMLALLIASLYPHYYGWWALINYLNEDYYSQWGHQIFFSITEMLSTAIVLHLCNHGNRFETWKLLLILNINLMHIIIGCLDQFVGNIMYREGKGFEVVRDLALFMPDILHVLVAGFEIQILAEHRRVSLSRLFYREELMLSGLGIVLFSLLGKNLWRKNILCFWYLFWFTNKEMLCTLMFV